ncbi:MAG: hypothetical protein ACOYT4_02930 [Nanoarchaeota archaeon]
MNYIDKKINEIQLWLADKMVNLQFNFSNREIAKFFCCKKLKFEVKYKKEEPISMTSNFSAARHDYFSNFEFQRAGGFHPEKDKNIITINNAQDPWDTLEHEALHGYHWRYNGDVPITFNRIDFNKLNNCHDNAQANEILSECIKNLRDYKLFSEVLAYTYCDYKKKRVSNKKSYTIQASTSFSDFQNHLSFDISIPKQLKSEDYLGFCKLANTKIEMLRDICTSLLIYDNSKKPKITEKRSFDSQHGELRKIIFEHEILSLKEREQFLKKQFHMPCNELIAIIRNLYETHFNYLEDAIK